MSDDQRMFKGYGRAWTEDKATGISRFFQIMREPATRETHYITAGFTIAMGIAAMAIAFILATA